jgi:hypothetical protein
MSTRADAIAWFEELGLTLAVAHDEKHNDWAASLSSTENAAIHQARYGIGSTADDAAQRARERYQEEQ